MTTQPNEAPIQVSFYIPNHPTPIGCLHRLVSDRLRIFMVVQNNLLSPITIDQLAARCGLSPSSFKRKFKAVFGEPPHKCITRQRLAHAKTLLLNSTLSIKEIGFACGFTSPSHFIRIFKAHFGTTPAALRSALLNRALKNGIVIYK